MTRDWFAVVAGPLAWFIAHVACWMAVPGAHEAGRLAGLYAIDVAALAISVVAGVLALGRIRRIRGLSGAQSPDVADTGGELALPPLLPDRRVQRAWFLALSGLGLSALSILLVLGLTMPILLLSPGAEP
jgi:hypothetical protein